MRFKTVQIAIASLSLCWASMAGADQGPTGDKGKASAPPPSAPAGGGLTGVAGGAASEGASGSDLRWGGLMDIRKAGKGAPKPWEVGVGLESHTLLIQNDLEGSASNREVLYGYAYGHVDITKNNRISAQLGFYQRFLAQGSQICADGNADCSGWQVDDIYLTYTRSVELPWKLMLGLSGTLSIPISRISRLNGLITAPRIGVDLKRSFAFGLSVDLRVFGTYYIDRYTTSGGGSSSSGCQGQTIPGNQYPAGFMVSNCDGTSPNPVGAFGGLLEADYEFWFHKRLTIGADLFTEYIWYHFDPSSGAVAGNDLTNPYQPTQQIFGAEIFLRYSFPQFYGVKTDLQVAMAQGDPTLGYSSVLHDGVQHALFNDTYSWRTSAEFYASLNIRY